MEQRINFGSADVQAWPKLGAVTWSMALLGGCLAVGLHEVREIWPEISQAVLHKPSYSVGREQNVKKQGARKILWKIIILSRPKKGDGSRANKLQHEP